MGSSAGAAADIWSRKPLNDAPKSCGEMAISIVLEKSRLAGRSFIHA